MKTIRLFVVFSLSLFIVIMFPIASTNAIDREEGGYVGCREQGNEVIVYNFLKHFSIEQYIYGYVHHWTYDNNNWVDAMDFVIFGGHGTYCSIALLNGNVNLVGAGGSSHKGYGNVDCEFVVFRSCKVILSPLEIHNANWYLNWTSEPDDIFDGLHQALGYRTVCWRSTGANTTDYFGYRISHNYGVWESWFDAINAKGSSVEMGSAVMHPTCDGDTYGSFAPDPPENSTWLRIWYQH